MPRDDLSIDWNPRSLTPRRGFDPNMPQVENQDGAFVLDEFTNRAANMPNEIAFMHDEITEKDKQMQECLEVITKHDNAIQKFIKMNGSHVKNPKEEALTKIINENYDKAQVLQEEKIALARKAQMIVDKHTEWLDRHIKSMVDRKEMPFDPALPSLLNPPAQKQPRPELSVATMPLSQITNSAIPHARHPNQHPQRPMPHAQAHQMSGMSSSAPATPAASIMMNQQRAREASLGATANKRQRLGGATPLPPSGLARQASMTPNTPRAGTPTAGRAGSVGPRIAQKSTSQKAPPKGSRQSGALRKPKKSGLSRVIRTVNKNSPSSTNDSELSDAETGTGDEEEDGMSPKKDADGDAPMPDIDDDENGDDKKYCICQSVSYGDMVACDNEECPFEWFHWTCVGLKSEPKGIWFCPVCTEAAERKK